MPVAYTTGLSAPTPTDFNKTLATLGQQQARRAAQQKAIMDQMQARQKATDKMLSEVEGYDVSTLIPPLREHFKTYMGQKMQEIQNFAIDDPLKARMAVQDIANWFNVHSAHNSEEVQMTRDAYLKVANDPSQAAKFNENLPVYQQSAATPEGSIMAQQQFEGAGITTYMGDDGTVFFKNIDPETGEETGDWKNITSWETWANPSTFEIPTTSRYGKSAIQIGESVVRESAKAFNKDTWDRGVATKSATGIVNSGSESEDGASARAWAVENLWGDGYKNNESLVSSYITGDRDNSEYKLHEDYISNKNNELIKEMVDASRFFVEEPDDDDDDKPTYDVRSEFDSKSEFKFNVNDLLRQGELLSFDEYGRLMNVEDMSEQDLKGTRYTLGSLAKNTRETQAIKLNNPNFGQEHKQLDALKARYDAIDNKNSANAQDLKFQIENLEYDLGDTKLEPEVFDLNLNDMVFLPNGKLALMNLSYKGSKVKTIMLDKDNDKAQVDQIVQAIRRVYKDDSITFEKLQKGLVLGPEGESRNVIQDITSSVPANQPKAGDSLFE